MGRSELSSRHPVRRKIKDDTCPLNYSDLVVLLHAFVLDRKICLRLDRIIDRRRTPPSLTSMPRRSSWFVQDTTLADEIVRSMDNQANSAVSDSQ